MSSQKIMRYNLLHVDIMSVCGLCIIRSNKREKERICSVCRDYHLGGQGRNNNYSIGINISDGDRTNSTDFFLLIQYKSIHLSVDPNQEVTFLLSILYYDLDGFGYLGELLSTILFYNDVNWLHFALIIHLWMSVKSSSVVGVV